LHSGLSGLSNSRLHELQVEKQKAQDERDLKIQCSRNVLGSKDIEKRGKKLSQFSRWIKN
jgi:hypothetical protein